MSQLSGVQDFFREWSRTYDTPDLQARVYRPLQDELCKRLRKLHKALAPLNVVLDVGTGTGQALGELNALAPTVIGLDPSMDMLVQAQSRRPPGAHLMLASSMALPLRDASVDAVVSCFSIHWWRDVGLGFREIHRVLRPGGAALIMIPTSSLLAFQSAVGPKNPQLLVHWQPPSWYSKAARSAGLQTRLPVEVTRGAWLLEAWRAVAP